MTKIFLDMDGVIADFVTGICKVHDRRNPYLSDPKSTGVFEMDKLWGISAEDFWRPVYRTSYQFWSELEVTPEAKPLVEQLTTRYGADNICILSAPSQDLGCIPGKQAWMRNHFPELSKNMLFGSAKRFLAGPDRILIDDRDENIENFNRHGGDGIHFPRPWNSRYSVSSPVEHVMRQLDLRK